ncbi:MAG: hypothetical protein ACI965_000238 [Paraglaciecola sp.]|jgi:hypothetical protein
MPKHQLLDNVSHKDLRIITEHKPEYGDTASYTTVFVSELRDVQGHYPLFFRKNSETAQFEAIALFGFAEQENLYLDDMGWHASYIPLTIQRRPFLIGTQNINTHGILTEQTVVHIDMDSPRISSSEGEMVFLPQGGQSPFLQGISSVLKNIDEGHQQTRAFIDVLLANDLIEAVSIKVQLDNGSQNELGGLYTINEEKVAGLSSEPLNSLHQQGYLHNIHMILASMSNMTALIEKKNKKNSV